MVRLWARGRESQELLRALLRTWWQRPAALPQPSDVRERWASCSCEHALCQQQSLLLFIRLLRIFLRNKMLLRNIITQITAVAWGSWKAGQQPFPGTCLPVAQLATTQSISKNPGCGWGREWGADAAPQPPWRSYWVGFSEERGGGQGELKLTEN